MLSLPYLPAREIGSAAPYVQQAAYDAAKVLSIPELGLPFAFIAFSALAASWYLLRHRRQ